MGIGKPAYKEDLINYVIGPISTEEKEILQKGVNKAAEAVLGILKSGIDIAMNQFNGKES